MFKLLNIILLILILIFFLSIYKYYSSSKNSDSRDFNRNNINQLIKDKISELSVLPNDTNNVIIFNDSFFNKEENVKPRSFWNLLKSK
jgi:hypothetical protein